MRSLEIKRELAGHDIAVVSDLLDAAARVDGRRPLSDHLHLDLVNGGSDGFTAFIACDDDHPVGYAQISRGNDENAFELVIHPDHRDEMATIGRELIDAAFEVVADDDGGHVNWWVYEPTGAYTSLADAVGMTRGRTLYQMRRSLPTGLPVTIDTRGFEPGLDDQAWLSVNNRAFAGHGEQDERARARAQDLEPGVVADRDFGPFRLDDDADARPEGEPGRVTRSRGGQDPAPPGVGHETGERLTEETGEGDARAQGQHPARRGGGGVAAGQRRQQERRDGQDEVEGDLARQAPRLGEGLEGSPGPALTDDEVDEHGGHIEHARRRGPDEPGREDHGQQGEQVGGQDPRGPPQQVGPPPPGRGQRETVAHEGGAEQEGGEGEEDRDPELAPHGQTPEDPAAAGTGPKGHVRQEHEPGRDRTQQIEAEDSFPDRPFGVDDVHLPFGNHGPYCCIRRNP